MQRLRLKSVDATTAPRIVLLLGIFLSPSFLDLGSVKPFDVSKVAVLWFFAWLAFAITIIEIIRGEIRPVRFRLATVAGLFLASTGIATLFSRNKLISVFGWYGRYNGLLEILLYVVIFWLVAQLYWQRPERLKEIFFAIAAASVVLVCYIFIQYAGLDPIRWIQPSGQKVYRYFGTMGNSNFAGGYLGATSAWLVFAFWRAKRVLLRLVVVGWALVTMFALWETSSRDGMFGALIAACVTVFVFRRRLPRFLKVLAVAVAGAVVVVGVAAAFLRPPQHPTARPVQTLAPSAPPTASPAASPAAGSSFAQFTGGQDVLRNQTFLVRTFWWRSALRVFASSPIVGAGPDTFVTQYPRYALPGASKVPGTERTDEPHNVFLEHASSLGILGIGTYLALIVLAFRWGLRRMRVVEESESDLLGSLLVLAAGYLGQGFFSIDVAALAAIGWIALGGIAAVADPAFVSARERLVISDEAASFDVDVPPTPPRRRRRVLEAVAMVLLAAVVVAGLRPWLADRAAKQAQQDAGATASTDIVMRSYRRAISLAPYDPVYRGLAANFLVTQASKIPDKDVDTDLLNQAIDLEKQMDALQPGNAFWKSTLAGTYAALAFTTGDASTYEDSEAWYADAASIARYDFRVPTLHGMMLNRWGLAMHDGLKYCQAIGEFNRANGLRPVFESYVGLGQAYGATGHLDEALAALRKAQTLRPTVSKEISVPKLIDRVNQLKKRKIKVITCQ
jgi:tetratricopeptide (TPR) repeat protein